MAEEDKAVTATPTTSPDVPQAGGAKLIERIGKLAAVIKLGSVYEFLRVGPKAQLNDDKVIVPHTWAGAKVLDSAAGAKIRAAIPNTRKFSLTNQANTKYALDIPVGVTVVLGMAGSGKTRLTFDHLFASSQARGESPLYIKMHEPGDEDRMLSIAKNENMVIPDFEIFLANTLATELFSYSRDLIIIDSIRYLFYSSSGGATGKGGVNMSLFMDLTHLDVLAARLKQRVIVVVNPMTDDPTAFDYYVQAAVGAVSGVIVMDTPTSARFTNRYSASRDLVSTPIPSRASTDSAAHVRTDASQSLGSTTTGNVAVSSTIFGRNFKKSN